ARGRSRPWGRGRRRCAWQGRSSGWTRADTPGYPYGPRSSSGAASQIVRGHPLHPPGPSPVCRTVRTSPAPPAWSGRTTRPQPVPSSPLALGLRENWWPFALLVVVNAFVGAMVGMERAVLPLLAEAEFGLASRTAILSFVASFGLAKALANLAAGHLGDRHGRKAVLVAGWLVGLPVPFLLMAAPTWGWVVFANVLLGVNQGLAWSSTVV